MLNDMAHGMIAYTEQYTSITKICMNMYICFESVGHIFPLDTLGYMIKIKHVYWRCTK